MNIPFFKKNIPTGTLPSERESHTEGSICETLINKNMRILILGAGKMGSFFTDILSFQHETAVFDVNPHQLRFVYNTYRFTTLEEIKEFEPELVINAVTVKYTLDAFRKVLPVLPKDCIISDIASVKTGLKKFYEESGFRYVSSHPMFGPTFASLSKDRKSVV